jgi:hypothetical protein
MDVCQVLKIDIVTVYRGFGGFARVWGLDMRVLRCFGGFIFKWCGGGEEERAHAMRARSRFFPFGCAQDQTARKASATTKAKATAKEEADPYGMTARKAKTKTKTRTRTRTKAKAKANS